MSTIQRQAGGCRILFTEYCKGTRDDLRGLRRDQDDCDAVIAAAVARRDEIDRRMDALLRVFGNAVESMHEIVLRQPPETTRSLRSFDANEPSVAALRLEAAHARRRPITAGRNDGAPDRTRSAA